MASRIADAKESYNLLMDGVEVELGSRTYGFAETRELPYPRLFPASTMMLTEVAQTGVYTGGLTRNEWRFLQTIYVDFSGEDAEAIEELELFIEGVQTAVRRADVEDLFLPSGHVLRLEIDGSIRPGDGDLPNTRVAFKEFIVTMETEET